MVPNPEEAVVIAPCTGPFKGGPGNQVSGAAYTAAPRYRGTGANLPNHRKRNECFVFIL